MTTDTAIETNPLTGVQYKLEIHNLPHVNYHMQTAILPSVQTDAPILSTPNRIIPLTGSQLNYDPFNIEFIIDDKLNNYSELYNWMLRAISEKHDRQKHFSDATLHILNGDLTPNQKITFYNTFPTLIAELAFDSGDTDSTPTICSAVFSYSHFKLESTINFDNK
jgi:hypothetical protein